MQSGETTKELVLELSAPDQASAIRKVRGRIGLVLEDPTASDGQTMRFRLVGRGGRPVVFPLKLISTPLLDLSGLEHRGEKHA